MASVFADGDFVFLEKGRQGLLASLAFRENRMRHFRCLLVDFSAYGGSRREDPDTQQKSRDRFVHGEWKFIQNGGQDKE